jgi:hypothetical protein
VIAALLSIAILEVSLLAVSPHAHEEVHADADHHDHVCAVTLATQGFCDTAALPPVVAAPTAFARDAIAIGYGYIWTAPDYWHVPAQAPPAD